MTLQLMHTYILSLATRQCSIIGFGIYQTKRIKDIAIINKDLHVKKQNWILFLKLCNIPLIYNYYFLLP